MKKVTIFLIVLLTLVLSSCCQPAETPSVEPPLAPTEPPMIPEPPEIPAPTTPILPEKPKPTTPTKIEVEWIVKDTEIELPPAGGEGLYSGTIYYESPAWSSPTEEGTEIAKRILNLEFDREGFFLAITRDPNNKNVVLAGITICPTRPSIPVINHLFLSIDGEKSWREINLFAANTPSGEMMLLEVRVVESAHSISLFAFASNDNIWRQANLQLKNGLP